jgi:hypothetical protein
MISVRVRSIALAAVGALGVSLLLAGCSSAPEGLRGPCPTPPVITPMSDEDMEWFEDTALIVEDYAKQLIGFDELAAERCVEDAGLSWRVIARDGEFFAVTADYSPQRVNAVIEKSVVTEASAG